MLSVRVLFQALDQVEEEVNAMAECCDKYGSLSTIMCVIIILRCTYDAQAKVFRLSTCMLCTSRQHRNSSDYKSACVIERL